MKPYSLTFYRDAINVMASHYNNGKTPIIDSSVYFFNMSCKCPNDRFKIVQLGYKQAWVITDTLTGDKFLQSYSTIVSIYFKDTAEIKTLGKWSRTTSKHQQIFESDNKAF